MSFVGSERHGAPVQRNQGRASLDGQVLFYVSDDPLFQEQSGTYKRQKQTPHANANDPHASFVNRDTRYPDAKPPKRRDCLAPVSAVAVAVSAAHANFHLNYAR